MMGTFCRSLLNRSLASRLSLASLCILPLFLGAAGYLLDRSYAQSLLAGEHERLKVHVYLLLGTLEMSDSGPVMPDSLGEPLFSQPNSGLYAWIGGSDGVELWRSRSADVLVEEPAWAARPAQRGGRPRFVYDRSAGFLTLSYPVTWERESGAELAFTVVVAHASDQLRAALAGYRLRLWQGLAALGSLLILGQLLVLRWGLKPLARLADDLARVESAEFASLRGDYPGEVRPVTDNLNMLLERERRQRARYRDTMADLAHSLKTPLAILGNLAASGGLPAAAEEPLHRMSAIVTHQLQRASRGADGGFLPALPLRPIVERLCASLGKVYADAPMTVTIHDPDCAAFAADERDLMEMLGNVLDNAWKYGRRQLLVEMTMSADALSVAVHDDGPGIRGAMAEQLFLRGERGQTDVPGQGIGLAVVADIAAAYRGDLATAESATLGGALLRITLPTRRGCDSRD